MFNYTKRFINMVRNLFNLGLINALRTWSSDCKKTTQGIKKHTVNSQITHCTKKQEDVGTVCRDTNQMLLSVDDTGLLGSSGYLADKLLLWLDSILLMKANIATYTAGQPRSFSMLLQLRFRLLVAKNPTFRDPITGTQCSYRDTGKGRVETQI